MASNDVKTLIEQRASALADGFRTEDVDKLMSFFSEDVDFSDIGTPAPDVFHFCTFLLPHFKQLTFTPSPSSQLTKPSQPCQHTTSTTPRSAASTT